MQFRTVENLATKRKTYYLSGKCGRLYKVAKSLFDMVNNGGRYSCSIVRTVGNRRYFEHCREW